jgi:hypothetical protein
MRRRKGRDRGMAAEGTNGNWRCRIMRVWNEAGKYADKTKEGKL